LKSNAHLIIDARNGKNLTHLQSILLFKDSSEQSEDTEKTLTHPPPVLLFKDSIIMSFAPRRFSPLSLSGPQKHDLFLDVRDLIGIIAKDAQALPPSLTTRPFVGLSSFYSI